MSLSEYFENSKGIGVLATADKEGVVNVAVYARPHMKDENTATFLMADRLTHANLQSNPHAAYLFVESGGGYKGKRLHLTKTAEDDSPEAAEALRRRPRMEVCESPEGSKTYVVTFRIDKVLPLIGSGDRS